MLTDPSASARGADGAHMLPRYDPQEPVPSRVFQLEREEHPRLLRLFIGGFTKRKMKALRTRIRQDTINTTVEEPPRRLADGIGRTCRSTSTRIELQVTPFTLLHRSRECDRRNRSPINTEGP
ncbi:hypothetical protein ACWCQQ_33605 [Streptomyces sp. NPDC002143]